MFENFPDGLDKFVPGVAGSALALFFMRRTPFVLIGMFAGGCILSFYGTHWASIMLGMEQADGLVGFLLGLFGMALSAKAFDAIEAINPGELWSAIKDWFRKRLGV